MDDTNLKTFNAIVEFVKDLNSNFGRKYKPVALYNRLLEKTTLRDVTCIKRHIDAFKSFFNSNPKYITNSELNDHATINYSDRVFLNINSILNRTDHASHDCIRNHLLTIASLAFIGTPQGAATLSHLAKEYSNNDANKESDELSGGMSSQTSEFADAEAPVEEALPNLEDDRRRGAEAPGDDRRRGAEAPGDDRRRGAEAPAPPIDLPDTAEGKFLNDALVKMSDQFKNMQQGSNPMQMMSGMMQSGFLTKFMGDMQQKIQTGEMKIGSLLSTAQSVMTKMTPEGPEGEQIQRLTSMTAPIMSQISTAIETGGEVSQDSLDKLKTAAGDLMKEVKSASPDSGNGGSIGTDAMLNTMFNSMVEGQMSGGDLPENMINSLMGTVGGDSMGGDLKDMGSMMFSMMGDMMNGDTNQSDANEKSGSGDDNDDELD
jgi:hypothetical protein